MNDYIVCGCLVLLLLALLTVFLFNVYKAFRTGVVYAKSHPYRRDSQPIFFWATVTLYIGVVVGMGGFIGFLGFQWLQGR